jgi:hypothetical protein
MDNIQLQTFIKPHHIVCATPLSLAEFNEKSKLALFLDKTEYKNYTIVDNNTTSLSKVYNSFITEENKGKNIIFIHDDVLIEDLFFTEKLDIAFEKYEVIGLAGSKKVDLTKPAAWHLMSAREDMVGEVGHSHQGKTWTTVFGPTNSRALVLDGLFIGVNVSRLLKTNTRFDEDFDFHHYDISFCLKANQNKLKMGVAPIKVTHFGLGDSMNTPEWNSSAAKFNLKYN